MLVICPSLWFSHIHLFVFIVLTAIGFSSIWDIHLIVMTLSVVKVDTVVVVIVVIVFVVIIIIIIFVIMCKKIHSPPPPSEKKKDNRNERMDKIEKEESTPSRTGI